MKIAYVLAALASTAVGAPVLDNRGLIDGLLGGLLGKLPVVSDLGGLLGLVGGSPSSLGSSSSLPLGNLLGGLTGAASSASGVIPSGVPTPSTGAVPSSVPSVGGSNGKLVQDLAPQLNNILTVTGPNVGTLLIELSPEVTALLTGLGLPGLGAPLGSIVASASGLGELIKDLGPQVEGLVTVVGADTGALLISLSPSVAGLLTGLGLPGVGVPVGTIVAIVGTKL
ncbi:hypothetical protein BDV32DRAFT_143906 [Aspergillus pseudonomiae]|uniref:Uncharacterized protein n=1 Tax=Aspergillus pseudonomiae TaxID=1506151 RepID=A0A5N6IHG0_9EURO|nr:uncharacterized protein BDV37DRAFT_278553 [Aspergillus pseudonomiae]KAB8266182.1 hypothetical protein BDV32DRAFT_143906 [Aspergillus pseudonomiae]KAE8409047.1 hypothetical protein BDV37DRAFT_278553 [Aspergillus pseudonomiae]